MNNIIIVRGTYNRTEHDTVCQFYLKVSQLSISNDKRDILL